MPYAILDSSILQSTILKNGPVVLAVWTLVLASKDKFNETRITPSAIAGLLRIDDEDVEKAWNILISPDPQSRHKEFEGRRIVPAEGKDGAWFVVTGDHYQELASKASAEKRKQKYEKNRAARDKSLEPSAYTCQRYGCTRTAAAIVDGRAICSAHAVTDEVAFDVA
jgi:hypothetical protein